MVSSSREPSIFSAGAKQKAASPSSFASRKLGLRLVTTVPMRSARMSWAWSISTVDRYSVYPLISAIRRQTGSGWITSLNDAEVVHRLAGNLLAQYLQIPAVADHRTKGGLNRRRQIRMVDRDSDPLP